MPPESDEQEQRAKEIRIFEQWAIVELFGHVKLAGRVTEEDVFGRTLGRIDIPTLDGGFVTQYFGGGSIYRLTPCSEEAARQVARGAGTPKIYRLELTAPPQPPDYDEDPSDFDDDDDVDDDEGERD